MLACALAKAIIRPQRHIIKQGLFVTSRNKSRNASDLVEETNKGQVEPTKDSTTAVGPPRIPRFELGEPIPHALLKRAPVEYHGVLSKEFNDESLWLPAFRFPYFGVCIGLARFKVFLTAFTSSLCLLKLGQFIVDPMGTNLLWPAVAGASTLIALGFIGNQARRLVMQIYVSEDGQCCRLARLSFYGNRRDIVVPCENVIPIKETNVSPRNVALYIKFRRPEKVDLEHDNYEFYDETLVTSLLFGGVVNLDALQKALGDVSTRRNIEVL